MKTIRPADGIDVGGTTTDAVLTEGRTVLAAAAGATGPDDVAGSVLGALDGVLTQAKPAAIERVVLSTTVITNLLAENKADRVGLVLIPGPGADPSDYELPPAYIVNGAIDYRGREVAPLNERELRQGAKRLVIDGNRKVALVGKFCSATRLTNWLQRPSWRRSPRMMTARGSSPTSQRALRWSAATGCRAASTSLGGRPPRCSHSQRVIVTGSSRQA
jgi:hypothetical protein